MAGLMTDFAPATAIDDRQANDDLGEREFTTRDFIFDGDAPDSDDGR